MVVIEKEGSVGVSYNTRALPDQMGPPSYLKIPSLSENNIDALIETLKGEGIEINEENSSKMYRSENDEKIKILLKEKIESSGILNQLRLQGTELEIMLENYHHIDNDGLLGGTTSHSQGVRTTIRYEGTDQIEVSEMVGRVLTTIENFYK